MRRTVVLLFLLSVCGMISARIHAARPAFEKRLQAAISEQQQINLQELTSFSWEYLYVFPPYTSKDILEARLGGPVSKLHKQIEMSDSITLLVFLHKGVVVEWCQYPRSAGEFPEGKYSAMHAVFEVKTDTDNAWRQLVYRPAPVDQALLGNTVQEVLQTLHLDVNADDFVLKDPLCVGRGIVGTDPNGTMIELYLAEGDTIKQERCQWLLEEFFKKPVRHIVREPEQ